MNRFRILAILLCAAAWCLTVGAQEMPGPGSRDAPRNPPTSGVQDTEGFFRRNQGALNRISDRIRQLDRDRGYKLYLVVEPVLIAATAPERASELHQAWLPDGNGMVVVYESDSGTPGFGRDVAGDRADGGNPARVASFETNAIVTRAVEATPREAAPEVYLETLVTNLADGFDAYFKRRETPPPPGRSMKIGLLFAGTLALLGLGAIGVGSLMRHPRLAGVTAYRFPPVDCPERLGAPCGGGVTARRFSPPAAPE